MTHLPFIAAAYGLTIGAIALLATGAWRRLRRAQARAQALPSRGRDH